MLKNDFTYHGVAMAYHEATRADNNAWSTILGCGMAHDGNAKEFKDAVYMAYRQDFPGFPIPSTLKKAVSIMCRCLEFNVPMTTTSARNELDKAGKAAKEALSGSPADRTVKGEQAEPQGGQADQTVADADNNSLTALLQQIDREYGSNQDALLTIIAHCEHLHKAVATN
jgi:hypothetical protein